MDDQSNQSQDGASQSETKDASQSKTKKKIKRRIIFGAVFFVLVLVLVYATFTRFHFSTQTIRPLAQLQWNPNAKRNGPANRPNIIGHRGSGIETEEHGFIGNTRNAIQIGINENVDWIEIDIRMAHGGELVVFHDKTIDDKTTGIGVVEEMSVDQLKNVTVNVDPPEKILTLNEVFRDFGAKHKKWIFDIKQKEIEKEVLGWIREKISRKELTQDQAILIGTNEVLTDYRNCEFRRGFHFAFSNVSNILRVLFWRNRIFSQCRELGCEIIVIPVVFAHPSLIAAAEAERIKVWVYGVEDIRDFNYLAKNGVDAFIVDEPEKF